MFGFLKALFSGAAQSGNHDGQRKKLFFERQPDVLYAMGDVHGCHALMRQLEDRIAEDASREEGDKLLVRLGDYVDRGPQSAHVLDWLSGPNKLPLPVLNLAGNHEDVMLEFFRKPHANHRWLQFGGMEALGSYGIYRIPASSRDLEALLRASIPEEHVAFLESLPSLVAFPGTCLVHAGIDGGRPLESQRDEVLLWKRPTPDMDQGPRLLVHGHTPVEAVEISPFRVNVDTGAYATGKLSAVKITAAGISVLTC